LVELGVWRFVTGLGLGAPLPLVTSMIAEFTPRRWRSLGVALGSIGLPLGGLSGAALAQDIVPRYGWQSIFVAGAVLPALLAVVLLLWLPESPKFLARQAHGGERLRRLLARLAPGVDWNHTRIEFAEAAATARVRIWALLQRPYRADTLALWLGFLSNLIVVYVFFNWLPTVLGGLGLPVAAAIRGSLAFNLGGMAGSLLSAALIARFGSRYVARAIAVGSILSTFAIGQHAVFTAGAAAAGWGLYIAVALSGLCVNGMQILLYIVATHAYPTALRSAGVGTCGAVGRIGGLLSTAIGGAMIAAGLSGATFFAVLAAALLFALVAAFALRTHVPPELQGA
jgi:AAHS family 4-hydroxybenzoate transporter-like MFS transporter